MGLLTENDDGSFSHRKMWSLGLFVVTLAYSEYILLYTNPSDIPNNLLWVIGVAVTFYFTKSSIGKAVNFVKEKINKK